MNELINDLTLALMYLVPTCLVWYLGMRSYNLVTPFKLQKELTEKDNLAIGLSFSGYCLGLIVAIGGLYHGASEVVDVKGDLLMTVAYGVLAVVLMTISSVINDKIILPSIKTSDALRDGNVAVGIVEAGGFVANGLILYGALSGEGSWTTGLVFWGIGQIVLILVSVVYNMITPFNSKSEIVSGNMAVGIAYSGFLVAMGNILRAASQGNFISWTENLTNFGVIVGFALVVLPVVRFFLDKAILCKASLSKELSEDQNKGAGAIEAVFYLASSLLISWIMLS